MNFFRRSYQPILRYLYTEVKKRRGEISLHNTLNLFLIIAKLSSLYKLRSARLADKTRKELHKVFEVNLHVVNALGHIATSATSMEYMPHVAQQPRRNRPRNIIWFNPPFSKNVKTSTARSFLKHVDTHFPIGHKLHKVFNRNFTIMSVQLHE